VLELAPIRLAVIGCYGSPAALEGLALAPLQIRVAADELLVLGPPAEAATLSSLATERLGRLDPGALVFDVSDAHAAWTLRGPGWTELYARLCAIELPELPAVQQGLFAHVPAKLLLQEDELTVVVSSALGHHVRARLHAAAVGVELRELAEAEPLAVGSGERGR
jgi:hypothetical protein